MWRLARKYILIQNADPGNFPALRRLFWPYYARTGGVSKSSEGQTQGIRSVAIRVQEQFTNPGRDFEKPKEIGSVIYS